MYTKLGGSSNNLRLALADKVKQSKLRLVKFIDAIQGLGRPMGGSYRPRSN